MVTGTNTVQGGVVKDSQGSMQTTRMKFNSHNHSAPKGATSPPNQRMP
jgi:hypothetical protein